ncbi:hypothetical protein I3843_16G048000 [Carya illinoinensis]|nr:hypothetical protein I3760_16G046700 [Carya illinoinensis]KAG7941509.1 hypothetical protein I3843_16G048000 [Carya illinoinensis]
MDRNNRVKLVDKHYEDRKSKQEGKEAIAAKQQSPTSPVSPPSSSSSPSHEFSFTISLHSSSTPIHDKTNLPPSLAADLSPADDIFFHGHLLPLRLLAHLPVSPRSSTNTLDSFSFPIRGSLDEQDPNKDSNSCSTRNGNSITNNVNKSNYFQGNIVETMGKIKSKTYSLFGLARRRRGPEVTEKKDKEKHKRKLRFDVSHVLRRYVRMFRPLMFFRRRGENIRLRRQPYSFSGDLSMRNKQELGGRRREFSAPASMRTSPANSGLLVATAALPSSASDSTVEELQAAIQAAIAHCKNSISKEEKIKA